VNMSEARSKKKKSVKKAEDIKPKADQKTIPAVKPDTSSEAWKLLSDKKCPGIVFRTDFTGTFTLEDIAKNSDTLKTCYIKWGPKKNARFRQLILQVQYPTKLLEELTPNVLDVLLLHLMQVALPEATFAKHSPGTLDEFKKEPENTDFCAVSIQICLYGSHKKEWNVESYLAETNKSKAAVLLVKRYFDTSTVSMTQIADELVSYFDNHKQIEKVVTVEPQPLTPVSPNTVIVEKADANPVTAALIAVSNHEFDGKTIAQQSDKNEEPKTDASKKADDSEKQKSAAQKIQEWEKKTTAQQQQQPSLAIKRPSIVAADKPAELADNKKDKKKEDDVHNTTTIVGSANATVVSVGHGSKVVVDSTAPSTKTKPSTELSPATNGTGNKKPQANKKPTMSFTKSKEIKTTPKKQKERPTFDAEATMTVKELRLKIEEELNIDTDVEQLQLVYKGTELDDDSKQLKHYMSSVEGDLSELEVFKRKKDSSKTLTKREDAEDDGDSAPQPTTSKTTKSKKMSSKKPSKKVIDVSDDDDEPEDDN
jgi:hypothetical protein